MEFLSVVPIRATATAAAITPPGKRKMVEEEKGEIDGQSLSL